MSKKVKKITTREVLLTARWLFFALFFLVLGIGVGFKMGREDFGLKVFPSRAITDTTEKADMSLFWHVWNILERKYIDSTALEKRKMVYGAISGMVASLDDPYTIFLPPEANKLTEEDLGGQFGGIGIQLGYKDKTLAVISPLENTPAKKVGVMAGDIILNIKDDSKKIDTTTEGVSLPEAVKIIRGQEGTKVSLTLLREGEPNPIVKEITRSRIEVPTVVWHQLDYQGKKVAYVQVYQFNQMMEKQWDDWLKTVVSTKKSPNFAGVILDLRNNPGGYLNGAVFLASEFLKEPSIVVEQEYSSGKKDYYRVNRPGRLLNVPLVVLVNRGSASAAEIMAGALQHYKRAILVGEKTFGKGTVQEPENLPGGTGLHVTISRWLIPGGTSINKKGVMPDVNVNLAPQKAKAGKDLILEKGEEELLKLNRAGL